jgi:gamma-glutamylaminecyclotransferase
MPRLFVYGTLMQGEPLHHRLGPARFLGGARTAAAFDLVDLGPYPAAVGGGSTALIGELYEVDPATLDRLDELEGVPGLYRRTTIPLADGTPAEAYLMPRKALRGRPLIPSGDWRRR